MPALFKQVLNIRAASNEIVLIDTITRRSLIINEDDKNVRSACYSPNSRLLLTGGVETTKFWNTETGMLMLTLYAHEGGVISEDLDWCIKAQKLGYKLYLDNSVRIGHCGGLIDDKSIWAARGIQTPSGGEPLGFGRME